MNMFGLQGIAETINAFANDEIKDEVLPRFARGEVTGAMVLTEPDAGSDLQAVRLRAFQDEQGNWYLNGVKRFITNGCGEILLVLARSEPEITDGRGLSLFIAERSEQVKVRHLENKLGIHGSPTCELVFDNTPCRLIGERQRGLITYVMALMNGARVGIAAQSLGVAEAAYRLARTYAHTRQPVRRPDRAAAGRGRDGHRHEDRHRGGPGADLRDRPRLRPREQQPPRAGNRPAAGQRRGKTPQAALPLAQAAQRHADADEQVLLLGDVQPRGQRRDPGARRLGLHEGLRRRALSSATPASPRSTKAPASCRSWRPCAASPPARSTPGPNRTRRRHYGDPLLDELKQKLVDARQRVVEAVQFVKTKGTSYLDLSGRRLVDSAIAIIIGHLLLGQGAANERKKRVARRFIERELPVLRMNCEQILSGDTTPLDEYALLAGPVPGERLTRSV